MHLREWVPFDADGSLGTAGTTVKLTTVGAPALHVTETTVTRAVAPTVLEYRWGKFDMRWQLERLGGGTRLTLWTNIGRRYIAWVRLGGACASMSWTTFSAALRLAASSAPSDEVPGWQRLNAEYAEQFASEAANWSPPAAQEP